MTIYATLKLYQSNYEHLPLAPPDRPLHILARQFLPLLSRGYRPYNRYRGSHLPDRRIPVLGTS